MNRRNNLLVIEDRNGNDVQGYIFSASHVDLRKFAQDMFVSRLERERYFEKGYFGEVGWNLLLQLFARPDGVNLDSLCEAAGPSRSVSDQWVEKLREAGFLDVIYENQSGVNAPASAKITELGYIKMRRYLSSCASNWMGNI